MAEWLKIKRGDKPNKWGGGGLPYPIRFAVGGVATIAKADFDAHVAAHAATAEIEVLEAFDYEPPAPPEPAEDDTPPPEPYTPIIDAEPDWNPQAAAAAMKASRPARDDGGPVFATTVDYSDWSVGELKDELKARGLPVSGKKADLIARLG